MCVCVLFITYYVKIINSLGFISLIPTRIINCFEKKPIVPKTITDSITRTSDSNLFIVLTLCT